MVTNGQRTNVHGILEASREWQRIVELACRSGLAEIPAARPEFAQIEPVSPVSPVERGDTAQPDHERQNRERAS